jgi:hypothetical protein
VHVCVEWSSLGHHIVWWFVDIDLLLAEAVLLEDQVATVTAVRRETAPVLGAIRDVVLRGF